MTTFKVGDHAVTVSAFGSHAARRAVAAATAWRVPDGLDIALAACVPIPFGTADDCLFEFGRLARGESVLIQGGAGGVGLAAIQLAKRAGARVFATASTDAKLDRLREFGMDEGINYSHDDLVAAVMRATDNRGVNLVVDPVGGDVLAQSLRCIGYRGRVVTVGNASRGERNYDIRALAGQNQSGHRRVPRRRDHDAARAAHDRERTCRISRPARSMSSSTNGLRCATPRQRTPTSKVARHSAASS